MEIKYLGHASFLIKTKSADVVVDPFGPSSGLKFPKTKADIALISHDHDDHNYLKHIEGEPVVFDWPGEYDCRGVALRGFPTYHDDEQGAKRGQNVMFKITAEQVSMLHCGDIGHMLDDKLIDEIGNVDILFVPVGGYYTIDHHGAVQLTKKIEPALVIPMHFARPGLDATISSHLKPVSDFVQAMGQSGIAPQPKLTIKREDVAQETNTKVVLLESQA